MPDSARTEILQISIDLEELVERTRIQIKRLKELLEEDQNGHE